MKKQSTPVTMLQWMFFGTIALGISAVLILSSPEKREKSVIQVVGETVRDVKDEFQKGYGRADSVKIDTSKIQR